MSSFDLRFSPPTPSNLPALPFEIIRRILRHRLALTSSVLASPDDVEDGSMPALAGQSGRRAAALRRKEREEVMCAALGLMRVCKSWKPVVLRYLYTEPALTSSSVLLLTAAVLSGDKKWDDTRLHPHSVPGRYITTLDLSTLSDGYFGPHITALSKACAALLPVLPNLTHLKLPGDAGVIRWKTLMEAPCVGKLRALEGVQVGDEAEEEDGDEGEGIRGEERAGEGYGLIRLLRCAPALEVLSILGAGLSLSASTARVPTTPLHLARLHTLTLDGVHHGPLLSYLTHSELPSLRRLLITSYNGTLCDGTTPFLTAHGHNLTSLTFLPTREWPAIHPTPPTDILSLCPVLREIALLIPDPALQKKRNLALALLASSSTYAADHPLRSITLPKWIDRVRASPSPSPAPVIAVLPGSQASPLLHLHQASPARNAFLSTILLDPPPNLRDVRIDGFTWVSPRLGRAAQHAGAGGDTRIWAAYLTRRGMRLLDGEGKEMPGDDVVEQESTTGGFAERGRRRGSKGLLAVSLTKGPRHEDEDGG